MNEHVKRFFLLADDDRDDAELFNEALISLSPPVEFAHVEDGRGVIEYLGNSHRKKPDIIFLDLNMPQMSGWQCLAKLKNDIYLQDIPVVMYSTSSHPRDKEIAVDLGAHGFVTKPTDFKELQRILRGIASKIGDDLRKALRNNEF